MSAYTDSVRGKVFKISSNNPNGNSFLEYDLTNLIKGKKIKLKAFIKTESIIKGVQPYYVGKLCLKFKVGTVDYYEAVQNLMGSLDWKEHYAEADGDHPNVFVGNELTVFNVPANATNVTLYFGLQNCTGTIYFSNIQVVEVL